MNAQEKLITQFYEAFQRKDYRAMQACYSNQATFTDDAFPSLNYPEVCAMWHMLLSSSSDLQLSFENVTADATAGWCRWTAVYTFTLTKRKVINNVRAQMNFEGEKILSHMDSFDFWKWARQAFGVTGLLLGWTPFFKKKVQATARQRLKNFIQKNPEYAS